MTQRLPDLADEVGRVALPRLRRASPVDTGRLAASWSRTSEGIVSRAPYMPYAMGRKAARTIEGAIADVVPAFEAGVVAAVDRATESL